MCVVVEWTESIFLSSVKYKILSSKQILTSLFFFLKSKENSLSVSPYISGFLNLFSTIYLQKYGGDYDHYLVLTP